VPEISVVTAADRAIDETRRRLFPAQLERWFALGFVAFLDQCGRGGGGSFNFPGGGGGGGGGGSEGGGPKQAVDQVAAFMAAHVVLVASIAAVILIFILAVSALVLWLRSRGTFMYLDNVATGRCDVGRPWREHADRAGSYFLWTFGLAIGTLVAVLLLLAPIVYASFSLFRHGARTGPIVLIVAASLLMMVLIVGVQLFSVALRDFVAPLQWYCDLSCGGAVAVFTGLLRAHPGAFVVYVLLKIVYSIVVGVAVLAFSCLACVCCCLCLGFLPVIRQTLLQPLFYFERRWSLELLQQFGYGPPADAVRPLAS
jgi:hypothetical protein